MTEFKQHPDGMVEVVRDPPFYWDRELKPITLRRWCELFSNLEYRFLVENLVQVPGTGEVVADIKTIWVGHDLMVEKDRIYVFETMVADSTGSRYFPHLSEAEARSFHANEVERQEKRAAEIAAGRG